MNLVTGATGFIGAHVLYRLVRMNRPVMALYRNPEKISQVKKIFGYLDDNSVELEEKINWIRGDVLDYQFLTEAFEDVTCVYHVAGQVSVLRSGRSDMDQVNVRGTENVVNACLEQGVGRLCHVSSIAALGESSNGQITDESVLWQPGPSASSYAVTKYKAEMEVWRGIQEGLQAVIVNPSLVIGPGVWLSAGAPLFLRVYKGLGFYPNGSCGYVDVRDVAGFMIKLTDLNISGERFILNSENLTHRDFINLVAEAMHKKKPRIPVSSVIAETACIAEKIRSMITGAPRVITKTALEIANARMAYSNRKIIDLLGEPFIPVKDSVDFAVRIFLAEKEKRSNEVNRETGL
ncbi:MAG: NAD-dependent epimerase/dehydratase family protein [Bacteroidales bacterium]|nr:NAD-dependent epimerase/dehydratase family protein [Bacteroidales bacterium]